MRGNLHYEERVAVAMEMLNESPPMLDRLKLRLTARRELEHFIRRTMRVLMGHRDFVPRNMKRYVRPMRRAR